MTEATWVPLSRRTVGLGPDGTLHEGVPKHMEMSLMTWMGEVFKNATFLHEEIRLRLQTSTMMLPFARGEEMLDVLDAVLRWHPASGVDDAEVAADWTRTTDHLERILDTGRSAWRVNAGRDGLERRIDRTLTAAVTTAGKTAPEAAAAYLRTAWDAAYGRTPDPDKAYDEAVLAIEALACPLVAPNTDRATLGTVIRDLRNQAGQWELAIGDKHGQPATIERLVEMLALIWEGQSRHAGSPNTRHQSHDEATAVVHLAAAIVQWLSTGVLRRKPSGKG